MRLAGRCIAPLVLAWSVPPVTAAGPDVFVADHDGLVRWGQVTDIVAYSLGTTSCNQGDTVLQWQASTSAHPVIAQNVYRLKAGRFEHVGMSWVKHGFASTNESYCFPCQDPMDGQLLGVGCSDPYSAGLNGNQSLLGPRSQVNATTGVFPYPFTAPPAPATIGRRLQIHFADIDPTQNAGAQYFAEGIYVTADDAAAGNGLNNASHRKLSVSQSSPGIYQLLVTGATERYRPAILAWSDADPAVSVAMVDVAGDGRLYVASKSTDLQDGFYQFEYAVFNLNSDRSVGSFEVTIESHAPVPFTGFHDVDYHSGEPYSSADWLPVRAGATLTWSTTPHGTDPNANAIRWGTLYNFRFRTTAPPIPNAVVTLGLFKPGSPASVTATLLGPTTAAVDCDNNSVADYLQIQANPSLFDCDNNGNLDSCDTDCDGNSVPDACDLINGVPDCNGNGVPDSCDLAALLDTDCNGNSIPDHCEIPVGSPAPGGPFYCTTGCDPDCNVNGIPDACDLASQLETDCDGDLAPDSCQIAANPGLDCNSNGKLDSCGETDCNGNLIPDDCEQPTCPGILRGDMDCNGFVTLDDLPLFAQALLAGHVSCSADMNLDGKADGRDVKAFVAAL